MCATVSYLVSRVNKRIWFVVVFGEPEIKCQLDSATWPAHAPGHTYNHPNMYTVDHRPALCRLSHIGLISKLLTTNQIYFSHLFQNKQLTLSSFNHPLSGREWKAISIRAMRSPGGPREETGNAEKKVGDREGKNVSFHYYNKWLIL